MDSPASKSRAPQHLPEDDKKGLKSLHASQLTMMVMIIARRRRGAGSQEPPCHQQAGVCVGVGELDEVAAELPGKTTLLLLLLLLKCLKSLLQVAAQLVVAWE